MKENEIKYQSELREKYNPDNIFKNRNNLTQKEESIENKPVALIEYKENIFKKMINKILVFFKLRK